MAFLESKEAMQRLALVDIGDTRLEAIAVVCAFLLNNSKGALISCPSMCSVCIVSASLLDFARNGIFASFE